jgi:hypothetical protein
VRKKGGWKLPTREERAEHVKTLTRLGELVIDRTGPMAVWFVVMSGFDDLAIAQNLHRLG